MCLCLSHNALTCSELLFPGSGPSLLFPGNFILSWCVCLKLSAESLLVVLLRKLYFPSVISANHLLPILFSVGWCLGFHRGSMLDLSTRRAICSLDHCPVPARFVCRFCSHCCSRMFWVFFNSIPFVKKSNFLFRVGKMDVFILRPYEGRSLREKTLKSLSVPNHVGDLSSY